MPRKSSRGSAVPPAARRRPRWRLFTAGMAVCAVAIGAWWMLARRHAVAGPNLLLITIDTLRADHVGVYGATTGATPALDALAARGVRFDQVQTAVPLTAPSHATILTGQYPPVHGVRGNVVFTLDSRHPTLATLLKRHGYRTAAFVGAYPVAAAFGFSQGFDTFDEEFHENVPGEQGAERRANEVADAALRWLEGGGTGGPFFAWLHFYDQHAPYSPPSPYREQFAVRPYDAESLFGRLNCHWATLRGWVKGRWKLVNGVEPELYDLSTDPHEERNLAATETERARRMADELGRALRQLAPAGDTAQPNPVSAEQEQRLRSLGYAAGSGGSGTLDDPSLPDPRTHVGFYDRLQIALAAQGAALPRAFAEIDAIVAADPANPFAHGALATMSYQFGSLAVAAREFARVLELEPDRPGVRQNYGKVLRDLGRYADSERELQLALAQTTEEDSRTRISLAETLIALNKTKDADALVSAVLA